MTKVIELPNAVKLTTQTQRRYVVVWTRDGKAHIELRSDNLSTVRKEWLRHKSTQDERWYLVDTVTGTAF
jgi:hypothetical protein